MFRCLGEFQLSNMMTILDFLLWTPGLPPHYLIPFLNRFLQCNQTTSCPLQNIFNFVWTSNRTQLQ